MGKMFPLARGRLQPCEEKNVIFLVRPKLETMDVIAENIMKDESLKNQNKTYHIFFVPRRSMMCEVRLQKLGVFGSLHVKERFDLRCVALPIFFSLIPFSSISFLHLLTKV